MSKKFDYAFRRTIGYEGGYSDEPSDRGGRTRYGITEEVFKDAVRRGLIKPLNPDIRELTVGQAKTIYKVDYWDRLSLDDVLNIDIAAEIFDTAVNMGTSAATKICQRALNYLGETLKDDGIMGPMTLGKINDWCNKDSRALFVCLNGFQFMRYVAIVNRDDSQVRFARGWTRRVQAYQT